MRLTLRSRTVTVGSPDQVDRTGYLVLAAEVDGRAGDASAAKRELVAEITSSAHQLRQDLFANVLVLTAMPVIPKGRREPGSAPYYDVAVLIQAPTVESAQWLQADPAFLELSATVRRHARTIRSFVTFNQRRHACEYGPRTPRVYVLLGYSDQAGQPVVPGWGWTYRRHVITDLLFSRRLHRYLRARTEGGRRRPVLYRLG